MISISMYYLPYLYREYIINYQKHVEGKNPKFCSWQCSNCSDCQIFINKQMRPLIRSSFPVSRNNIISIPKYISISIQYDISNQHHWSNVTCNMQNESLKEIQATFKKVKESDMKKGAESIRFKKRMEAF